MQKEYAHHPRQTQIARPSHQEAEQEEQQQSGYPKVVSTVQQVFGNQNLQLALQGQEETGPAAMLHSGLAFSAAGILGEEGFSSFLSNSSMKEALSASVITDPFEGSSAPLSVAAQSLSRRAEGKEVFEEGTAEQVQTATRRGGRTLSAELIAEMEREIGDADFSKVRIHTDAAAAQAADAIHAAAFTMGEDIYFNQSYFETHSTEGRALLAHELTHVAQYQQGRLRGSGEGLDVSHPSDATEREAEAVGQRVASVWTDASSVSSALSTEQASSGQAMGEAVASRVVEQSADTQASMDTTMTAMKNITLQVPVQLGKNNTWRVPVSVQASYRINQNNDAGEQQYGGGGNHNLGSTAPSTRNRDGTAVANADALRTAEAHAGQGKATPEEYQTVIQAAIDQSRIHGIPIPLVAADATGQELTEAGRQKVQTQARDKVLSYARFSYGVDCSGFVFQTISQIRQDNQLNGEWGQGIFDTGSQYARENGTAIPDPENFQVGDILVKEGHVRILYETRAATDEESTAIRRSQGLPATATLYHVVAYESSPSNPARGTEGYFGQANPQPSTSRWGVNKQDFFVSKVTTQSGRGNRAITRTQLSWYKLTPSGAYQAETEHGVYRVPTQPTPRQAPANGPAQIQRDGIGPVRGQPTFDPSQLGSGQSLPKEIQQRMEDTFGADFSQVRIHDQNEAHGYAAAFNANAFTFGTDIVFGKGKFNPGSAEGKKLLFHELTHIVQGGGGGSASSPHVPSEGSGTEQEARKMAEQILQGETPELTGAAATGLQLDAAPAQGPTFPAAEEITNKTPDAVLNAILFAENGQGRYKKVGDKLVAVNPGPVSSGQYEKAKSILEARDKKNNIKQTIDDNQKIKLDEHSSADSQNQKGKEASFTFDDKTTVRTSKGKGDTFVLDYTRTDGSSKQFQGKPGESRAEVEARFKEEMKNKTIGVGSGWVDDKTRGQTVQTKDVRVSAGGRAILTYVDVDGKTKEFAGKPGETPDQVTQRFQTAKQKLGLTVAPVETSVTKKPVWGGVNKTIKNKDTTLWNKETDEKRIAYHHEESTQKDGNQTTQTTTDVASLSGKATTKGTFGGGKLHAEAGVEAAAKLVAFEKVWTWEAEPRNVMGEQVGGKFYLYAKGMVGAEATAKIEANVQASMGKAKVNPGDIVRGTDMEMDTSGQSKTRKLANDHVTAEATASAEAFAGAKLNLGAGVEGFWMKKEAAAYQPKLQESAKALVDMVIVANPALGWVLRQLGADAAAKKILELLFSWGAAGKTSLLSVEGGIQGSAGVGGKLEAALGFSGGKLRLKFAANATWGLGFGGSVSVVFDAVEGVKFGLIVMGELRPMVIQWLNDNINKLIGQAGAILQSIMDWFSADDKVREMVQNKVHTLLPTAERAKMLETLYGGWFSGDDEEAVMQILRFSKTKGDLAAVLASGPSGLRYGLSFPHQLELR